MKTLATLFTLVGLMSLGSCMAGPQQLTRTVDDWDRDMYVSEPLIDGVLHVIPVVPLASFGAQIVDFLITNPYHFWLEDVWDGEGTNFIHADVATKDGAVKSLMIDGAKFLKKD